MSFILAIEARKSKRLIGRYSESVARPRLREGKWREVGTCSGAWFIRAIGTITVVIVDLRKRNLLRWIGYACESVVCGFVEFGNWYIQYQ